ncbi:MAG: AAA family ATPase [Nanoarchaeota archaeon]|nr:AAA family ATPase [Nanoarchaeota archaeon]MBU1031153.1 AAA family ATPase [Nanoarchaeota archaeon]MBU1850409.1 AAA family ATPase [Nanoarchaeota archaeon]
MKIKKLLIKNYKSIEKLEIDNLNDLNIYIGKNDAGKSNIIKALDLLFNANPQTNWQQPKITTENELETIYDKEIKYLFFKKDEPEAEITAYIEVKKQELEKLGLQLDLKNNYELVFSRKICTENNTTKVSIEFIRLDKKIILRTSDEKERFLTKKGNYTNNYEEFIGKNLLLELQNQFILVPANRNIIRDPTPNSEKNQVEQYIKDSLIKLANSEDKDKKLLFEQFKIFIDNISPLIEEVQSVEHEGKIHDLKFLSGEKTEIPLSIIGAGNNELLLLLHEIIVSGGKILAIEEPEIHLHPEAERKLYRMMKEFSSTTQMFIITHSPVMVEPNQIKNLYRIVKEGEKTVIYCMKQEDYIDTERLKQELNSENCEMFFADKVLLVEGISDKIMMEGLIEKYSKSTKEIKVVASFSKDNFEIYSQLLKIFKIPYAIMTDLDSLKGHYQIKPIYELLRRKQFKKRYERIDYLKTKNIFVLSRGALEDSYPSKYKRHLSKPLDALYALNNLTDEDYCSKQMKDLREVVEAL